MYYLRSIINIFFIAYTIMLIARILCSWFPQWNQSRFVRFIAHYTDPYLNIFRRVIPPLGMIDISPLVAFLALRLMQWLIVGVILSRL